MAKLVYLDAGPDLIISEDYIEGVMEPTCQCCPA